MTTLALTAWPARARALFPGVLACGVVAAAATFLSQHYGAPVMLAMIAYPMLVHWLRLDLRAAGTFLGGTIHDVAQVVGAGYGLSHETGDVSTLVKLMRVAMLLPVTVLAATLAHAHAGDGG